MIVKYYVVSEWWSLWWVYLNITMKNLLFTEVEVAGSGYFNWAMKRKLSKEMMVFNSVISANDYNFGMQMTELWLAVCSKIQ